MNSYNELITLIDAVINRNGVQAITGQVLNGVLKAMVQQLGAGYSLSGVAHPTDDPGTPEQPVCYFASEVGTYTNFGGVGIVAGELALLCYDMTDGWFKETMYEGFASVGATIDGNVGTPSVDVTYNNGILSFDFRNLKGNPGEDGNDGQDGAAAGFGTITASVDANVGTPSVAVTESGPDTAKNLAFAFHNLKGADGDPGVTSVNVTVDNTSGSPACAVSLNAGVLTLAFTGLKGAQGDTGSSVAYPFTIVNNLTTDDATQALSAAQGVVLEGEISQLEAEVTDLGQGIEHQTTGEEDDAIRFETDGGTYKGKVDANGGHFSALKVGPENNEKQVATLDDIPEVPEIPDETLVFNGEISSDESIEVETEGGETIARITSSGVFVKAIKDLNGDPVINVGVVIVDKNGNGNYTTIQAAINGTQDGDTILVMPGTYEEEVECFGKERHIVGLCRETCILINGTGNYLTPPLEMNIGSIRNMTIIADNYDPTIIGDPSSDDFDKTQRPSYGIHIEYANADPFELVIENCTIVSKWNAAIGAGVRYNQKLTIRDCELISEASRVWSTYSNKWVYLGGLYFHNDASVLNQSGAKVCVHQTAMRGVNAGLTIQSVAGVNNPTEVEFIGSTVISTNNGVSESSIYKWDVTPSPGYLAGGDISLAITSHGNNIESLNN